MNHRFFHPWGVYIVVVASIFSMAQNVWAQSEQRPILLLLLGTAADSTFEQQFETELQLQLETHDVEVHSSFSFASNTQPKQIEEIRPLATVHNAQVVAWVESIDAATLSLQMVFIAPNRSTMQSLQVKRSKGAIVELVISTRELLNDFQKIIDESYGTETSESQPAAGTEETAIQSTAQSEWLYLELSGRFSSGIVGSAGPSLTTGGALAIGYLFANRIYAQLDIDMFAMPDSTISDGVFQSIGVRPGVKAGYLFGNSTVFVGPFLHVQAPWQRVITVITSDNGESESQKRWWNLRVAAGIDFRFRVASSLLLALGTGAAVLANRLEFERESGATIFFSPRIEWIAQLGMIIILSSQKQ